MKKLLAFLSIVLVISVLAACGGKSEDVSTREKEDNNEEEQSEKDNSKDEPKIGTRSNPIKMNEIATIDTKSFNADHSTDFKTKVELSVEEVIRGDEAQSRLKEMNQFNDDAPEGYEWVLVKAKIKVVDSETEDHPFIIHNSDFTFVSESGDVFSGNIFPSLDPEIRYEMYKGNEKEGYTAGLIKENESATMKYEQIRSDSIFFTIEEE